NQAGAACSLGSKRATQVVSLDLEGQKDLTAVEQVKPVVETDESKTKDADELQEWKLGKFSDKRWKNGTWDLNMFVKDGKMDRDSVIDAEARRRKILELYPEESTNEEPVLFRGSIIPWWAWLKRSYLPEAELLSGRAAMVGFFMAYVVDALTGLDLVGQTGNLVCKTGLFVTVIGIILFRKTKD
ncbi:hypothetical protein RJ641_033486, partial [Dillenia turbinata]